MLIAHNDYFPYTIAPSSSVNIIIESVVTRLPILHPVVVVRSLEPLNTLEVTWEYQLIATAPMAFAGTWTNKLLDAGVVPAEGFLALQPVQDCMDGVYGKHRLEIANPSASASVLVHVLVNGMVESVTAAPAQTYVVTP